MGATIEGALGFHAVADDAAIAMAASGRQGVNGAFEAVEHVRIARVDNLETLVVVISTDFTTSHDEYSFA